MRFLTGPLYKTESGIWNQESGIRRRMTSWRREAIGTAEDGNLPSTAPYSDSGMPPLDAKVIGP
jgi:hypothetical protein